MEIKNTPSIVLHEPPFYLQEFEDAYRYIIEEYHIEPRTIGIFIPCAVRKPYSSSPSHRLFRKIFSEVFSDSEYHATIFGTCGTVPAELELMYPYAQYHYMLGKCSDMRIKNDFLKIETYRLKGYLEKTRETYDCRIAYCIGIFREAMVRASEETGIAVTLYPTVPTIERMYDDDCPFPEGSLSMQEYIDEFRGGLLQVRDLVREIRNP